MGAGTAFCGGGDLRIAGKIYSVESVSVRCSGYSREVKSGFSGIAGVKKTPTPGAITCTIHLTDDVDVATLNAMEDETVDCQLSDGRAYAASGCALSEPIDHDLVEGTADIEIIAPICDPV